MIPLEPTMSAYTLLKFIAVHGIGELGHHYTLDDA